MNKQDFTGVLQVALWTQEGLTELEIRQLLAELCNDKTIKIGIKLCKFLEQQQ